MRLIDIDTVINAVDEDTAKEFERTYYYSGTISRQTSDYIIEQCEDAVLMDTKELDFLIKQYEGLKADIPNMANMYTAQIKAVNCVKRMLGMKVDD